MLKYLIGIPLVIFGGGWMLMAFFAEGMADRAVSGSETLLDFAPGGAALALGVAILIWG